MAHNLDLSTGRAAYFGALTPAWHGLGTTLDHVATSAEAMQAAALDWTIEQRPLQTDDMRHVTTHVANVRTDTGSILGIVGEGYKVFQNAEAFDFLDSLVGEKLAMYHTAGALDGGRQVWLLAKLPGEYYVAPGDSVEKYTLLVTAHDGTRALRVIPTSVRVVCANTLALATSGARGGISIRHTASLRSRVEAARAALKIVGRRHDLAAEESRAMVGRRLATDEVRAYWNCLFPTQPGTDGSSLANYLGSLTPAAANALAQFAPSGEVTERQANKNRQAFSQIRANYRNPRNNFPGIEETAWSAYNAVSEYVDHQKTYRGKSASDRAENRLESVWFGSGNMLKQFAYSAALALAV
jgi:phage/plasmid-like protein (TIGR03299 family)